MERHDGPARASWSRCSTPACASITRTSCRSLPAASCCRATTWSTTRDVANDGSPRDPDASDPGDWITAAEANDTSSPLYGCTTFDSSTGKYSSEDSSWHGTQIAGLIAAITNNGIGMAGVGPNLRVLPVRVLGKCGEGYDSDIIAGMRWAAGLTVPGVPANANRARVINMSFGGEGTCTQAYRDAVAEIIAAGTVLVAAAGNTAGHAVGVPANCEGVIAVAGLRHVGTKVGFSDLGLDIAISAPGGNCVNTASGSPCLYPILTTSNSGTTGPIGSTYTDSYNASIGTSFSAPLVAGTVALMLSAAPSMTPAQVRLVLQATARPFPTSGGDNGDGSPVPQCAVPQYDALGKPIDQYQCYCTVNTCGAGMLDAGAAVLAAATGTPAAGVQASGLWWDLADEESGWGINIAHQGDLLFLTWYTYDASGRPWWLSMTGAKTASSPDIYTGQMIATHGPAFDAMPFDKSRVTRTVVGSGMLRFGDLNTATLHVHRQRHLPGEGDRAVPVRSLADLHVRAAAELRAGDELPGPVVGCRGRGIGLGHQHRASGRHHLRVLVHLRRRWLAAVAVRHRAEGGRRASTAAS